MKFSNYLDSNLIFTDVKGSSIIVVLQSTILSLIYINVRY